MSEDNSLDNYNKRSFLKEESLFSGKDYVTVIPNGQPPARALEFLKVGSDGEVTDDQIRSYCTECRSHWRSHLSVEGLQYWVRYAVNPSEPLWRHIRNRIPELVSE